jgi:hypothetical protein
MFGNLLNKALSIIPSQTVQWKKFKERLESPTGKPISVYDPPVNIVGSWQAVDTNTMQQLGLSMDKVHRQLYTSNLVEGIQRGEGADRIIADGYEYEVVGNTDWYNQDGWVRIIATRQNRV